MDFLYRASNASFRTHFSIAFLCRMILIMYGELQDALLNVSYTDIDYKVVTDGARHVWSGESPFRRHTYRYSPLFAYLLTPNIYLHRFFGKILFAVFDLLLASTIRQIIIDEGRQTFRERIAAVLKQSKYHNKRVPSTRLQLKNDPWGTFCSLFWLYNPMAAVIATRGNGDAITGLLTLTTILLIQRSHDYRNGSMKFLCIFAAGNAHALAIHLRLFPIIFSLAFYLNLSDYVTHKNSKSQRSKIHAIFQPNRWQILLATTTIFMLSTITYLFYRMYGYEFLYETYIYHLIRKDIRHNFSLYFYMQLLNTKPIFIEKLLTFLPQLLILLAINLSFGFQRKTLSFCIFLQTFIVVTFNPVVTSQYFIWYLAILPIVLKNLRSIGLKRAAINICLWIGAQGLWLLSAYLLEHKGWNTFGLIWLHGAMFFAVNCFIVKVFVIHFDVASDICK